MTRPARRSDEGFTLIELLVVIVILGVIMVPLTNLVIAGFQYFATTQTRLSDSHDIQITTAYFSQDASNTGSRDYTSDQPDPINGTAQQSIWIAPAFPASYCGAGLGSTVVLLAWDTSTATTAGGTQTVSRELDSVAYVAYSDRTLHRVYCPGTPTTDPAGKALLSSTVATNTTMAHNYQYPDGSNGTPVTCYTAGGVLTSCTSATPPATIDYELSIMGPTDTSATHITLTGVRRQT